MLRIPALRSFRSLAAPPTNLLRPASKVTAPQHAQLTSRLCTLSFKRPEAHAVALQKLNATVFVRQQTTKPPFDKVDKKHEKDISGHKLGVDSEHVTSTSSVHPLFSEVGTPNPEPDTDMSAGIRADLKTIKDTFDLSEVPRQAFVLGFAGVLPYLATSLSTVACAYEINHANHFGTGYIMSHDTAVQALHLLEHLQIGYGAVIISFLGAIHWGLEWANYGGQVGYPRYAIGVAAPAIAWPTTLLPLEMALITQFLAFGLLYYTDARACRRGWAPPWYGTYRFVLTFIVGAAIVITLIGRGEIGNHVRRPTGAVDRVRALREGMTEQLAKEEEAKRNNMVKEDEEAAEEDEAESAGEEEQGGDDESEGGEAKDGEDKDAK